MKFSHLNPTSGALLTITSIVLLRTCCLQAIITEDESAQVSAIGDFLVIDGDGFTIDEHFKDSIEEEHRAREELLHGLSSDRDKSSDKSKFHVGCPSRFFACDNGECVSPKWRCDGHPDCDDNTDELNCTNVDSDPKTHPRNSPAPPSVHKHDQGGELTFNSSQEPLIIFSTGVSIRGYWMRSRVYFDIVSSGLPPPKPETPLISQASSILFEALSFYRPAASKPDPAAAGSRSTIVGVDMDPHHKEVFWVELGKDAGVFSTLIDNEQFELRNRRQLSGPKQRSVVDSGLLSPEDVALDLVGKNIYITDAGLPAIVVCTIEHSHCKVIVKDRLSKPRAVIVDSGTGWLTYTDWGGNPGIFLVSMDGLRRETLIDTDVVWPNGLAADHSSNQLYWADARLSKIERIDLATRKRYEVIRETAANPFSLSLFENRVYWSDWSGNDIRTCHKIHGNGTRVMMSTDNIYGIHIYHPSLNGPENQLDPCWSKHCSHLCLIAPKPASYADRKTGAIAGSCACPESMALSSGDKTSCYEVSLSFLLVNVKNYIAQVFPERIGLETVEKVIYSNDHTIHDVASDWPNYRLFFFDAAKQHIYTVDMGGKSPRIEQFMPTSHSLRGLLYDSWSDNLYWLDSDKGTLSMCSVHGKFTTVIRKDLERPFSMVLDSKNRVFYVSMLGSMPHILRTDIFGDEQSDLAVISTDIGLPVALHLDEQQQRLYWADARRESIESIDLDIKARSGVKPSSRIYHQRKLGTVLAFAVYHDYLVWTVKNGGYLYMAKMGDQSSSTIARMLEAPKPVSLRLPPNPSAREPASDNKRIILVDPPSELVKGPCQRRGCSHGCVLDASHTAICVCPDTHRLQASNRTNCVLSVKDECAQNPAKCRPRKKTCPAHMLTCTGDQHCIYPTDMCDGHPDCEDGFDERNCTNHRTCASYEIQCEGVAHNPSANSSGLERRKCIPRAWLCDGEDDCGDWSDELNEKCLPAQRLPQPAAASNPCHDGSFPCASGECIRWSEVCDQKNHCLDGSDEGGKCLVSCEANNGGCAQKCRPSPTGPNCLCHEGYAMSNDTKSCELEEVEGTSMVWLIILLLLLSVTGLITAVSLLILYKQGRLPRQVSQLSVSFISQSHDKDGAMLLLDNDS